MGAPSSDLAGVKQVYNVLSKAGFTIETQDCDTGERIKGTKKEIIAEATAGDDGYFILTKDGKGVGWVFFVYGNSPEEVICDHTTNLSEWLDPLTHSWWD